MIPRKTRRSVTTEIRNRAYDLWEAAGRPEGREQEFWKLAEVPIDEEEGGEEEGSA
jgi:Protein of unknown function (DUF2934)